MEDWIGVVDDVVAECFAVAVVVVVVLVDAAVVE